MTVLLAGAHRLLENRIPNLPGGAARDLVYADDTLLADSDPAIIEEIMRCIEECGRQYGLAFNWQLEQRGADARE
eukprot:2057072-Pyramimonas_sp.AAC.1